MYTYKAKITNVVDGDTFDLDIDLGFHIHIHERVRILDLDTPEKRGEEKEYGLIVTQYANKFLGEECIIKSKQELKTDSFGRWLVELYLENDINLAEHYTQLGVNKKANNYSQENVLLLKKII